MGTLKFSICKSMIDRIVKSDTVVYAMWYIEDLGGGDTSLVQKYVAGPNIGDNTAELFSRIKKDAGYIRARQNDELVISDPISIDGEWVVGITVPLKPEGTVTGAVGLLIETELFSRIVSEAMDSEDVVCKLVSNNGTIVAHPSVEKIGQKLDEGEQTEEIVDAVKGGQTYSCFSYSGTLDGQAFKVYSPTDFSDTEKNWSFCTMVRKSSYTRTTDVLALIILFLILVGLSLLAITTSAISRMISNPIVKVSEELKLIAEGRLSETKELEVSSKDEIGRMLEGLNELSFNLKHLAHFAHEVGTGNLDVAFTERSEHDAIGKAMVEMKQNLVAARDAEVERKRTDEIQRWKVEGNARVNETIRKENSSIQQLCDAFLHELVTYSKSIQGGVFVINDDQESERHVEMISCIAYNRKKMMAKRIGIDEGLVGRCIYEKAPIILTEVPQDYLVITSGMGDRRPDFLAIVPLLNNEDVVGVVEVASFDEKPQYVLEYLEKAAESLASAIANVKVNERTQRLLNQAKMFAEEVAAQEEELRQNMEEMQASQEEMHRKTEEYEQTIKRLKKEVEGRE